VGVSPVLHFCAASRGGIFVPHIHAARETDPAIHDYDLAMIPQQQVKKFWKSG
jgi:hypothetical protein